MRRLRIALVLAAIVSGGILPSAAQAAFPGENGKIVFLGEFCNPQDPTGSGFLMSVEPDGSDWDQGPDACSFANFSPSGTRIMFDWMETVDDTGYFHFGFVNPDWSQRSNAGFGQTYSPDADYGPDGRIVHRCATSSGICVSGAVETEVVAGSCFTSPAWSPDGSRIALNSSCTGQRGIVTVPAAGGPVEMIVPGDFTGSPDWSPDGSKLVYMNRTSLSAPADLYSANADGSGVAQLTSTSQYESGPAWSPDGTQIAFVRRVSGFFEGPLHRMNADGTGVTQIPNPAAFGRGPDWQPLPVNTPSSYARPKSANPVQVSLVPAFNACTAPNREHGPPLAFGSCAPPVPGSFHLTVGVGDGHPAAARSSGFVRLKVTTGVPGGADDTTGRLRVSLTNVMRASDLSEYAGELRASVRVRITDQQGTVSQTVQDLPLELTVPCLPTPGAPGMASVCDLGTDLDAVLPGATPEGTRAIWQLDQVKVYDGGPDEDADTASDNELFAVQGVFVP